MVESLGDGASKPNAGADRPGSVVLDMRTTENEVAIEIIGLNKWFGEFHVLRDIDLKVMRGERIVICGPSGSGKSTLLRCINRHRGLAARPRHRRRHGADRRTSRRSTRCAARSAWCFSSSTCFRI